MPRQKKLEKISSPPRRLVNFSRTKKKLFDSAKSIWVHDKMLVGVMVFAESCRYHEYVPKRFDMTHIVRRYKSSCWTSIPSSGNKNIKSLLEYAEEASVLCDAKVGAIVFLNGGEVVHFPPESSRLMEIFDRWERLNEEQSTPGPPKSRFSEKSPTSTSTSKSNIAKLEALNSSLEKSFKNELHEKSLAIQSLQKESHLEIQNMQSELKVYNMTLQQINTKLTDFVITKETSYSSSSSSPTEEICGLKRQLAAAMENEKMAQLKVSELTDHNEKLKTANEELKTANEELKTVNRDLESKQLEWLGAKQMMHNQIMELKGNIRVFVRVRPLLATDGLDAESAISYHDSVVDKSIGITAMDGNSMSFTLDKIFRDNASQEDVFLEISDLVTSALHGYKVCVFAYGQTGSGKTFTMIGGSGKEAGMIPRSLDLLFQEIGERAAQGWTCDVKASIFEIYNDKVRGLISPRRKKDVVSLKSPPPQHTRVVSFLSKTPHRGGETPGFPPKTPAQKLSTRYDADGNINIADAACEVVVRRKEDVINLLRVAQQRRVVGCTNMNHDSSRSHFLLTLKISLKHKDMEQPIQGVITLVDLAGSERVSKSGAEGSRLQEAQAINSSLSHLATVIHSLATKVEHVPYRDKKLTHLLQPYMGPDSKTVVLLNISPLKSSAQESISSLRFGRSAMSCHLG